MCVCVCVRACVTACVCVRACVRACVRVCSSSMLNFFQHSTCKCVDTVHVLLSIFRQRNVFIISMVLSA